jgi:hypothetical protein
MKRTIKDVRITVAGKDVTLTREQARLLARDFAEATVLEGGAEAEATLGELGMILLDFATEDDSEAESFQ